MQLKNQMIIKKGSGKRIKVKQSMENLQIRFKNVLDVVVKIQLSFIYHITYIGL
jgi:hypothetical protein